MPRKTSKNKSNRRAGRSSKPKQRRTFLKPWRKLTFIGKLWRVLWVAVLSLFGFSLLQVLAGLLFNPPLTPLMVQRTWSQMHDPSRHVRLERDYVPLDEISPNLINAVNIAEDGNLFLYHHGFDIKSMKKAYINNSKGRKVRGGSTISQQTAKNCFLPHTRSMWRKGAEAYYTVLIEAIWGKRVIMERYLNVIEFGDGIYGCEAASQHYFHHSAAKLTPREAALLAACLPTPLRSNPGKPSAYLSRRASTLQHRMSFYAKTDFDTPRDQLNPKYLKQIDDENLFDFIIWMLFDGKEHRH